MKFVYRFNNITASSKMNNNIGFSGWSLQYVIRIVWSKPCIVVNISNEIFGCNIPRTTVNSRHLLQTGNTMRKKKPISIKNVYKYLVLHPAIFCNINRQITKRERDIEKKTMFQREAHSCSKYYKQILTNANV